MEKINLSLILSTLAELTSANLLWSILGLVMILTFFITLVFFYHWYKFIIDRRLALTVSAIYSIGTLIFLSGMALLINYFSSL